MSFLEIVEAYEQEYPLYVELGEYAHGRIKEAIGSAGIETLTTSARAKDALSFGIKACVGDKYDNPLVEIEDKSGIRVVVKYLRDVKKVVKLMEELFITRPPENKVEMLPYDKNGYLGTHLIAKLRDADLTTIGTKFADRLFEIQVRTVAESAWAEVSHRQIYKPTGEVPDSLKRRIYRLVALIELFDLEVEGFLEMAEKTPGYQESAALTRVGEVLTAFGSIRKPDRRLTCEIAAALVPLYAKEMDDISTLLVHFAEEREDAFKNLLSEVETANTDRSNPILRQPELAMIFERLETIDFILEKFGREAIPLSWLNDLAESWGEPIFDS